MNKKQELHLFYNAFQKASYPCFWLGYDGTFWQNDAALNTEKFGDNAKDIEALLRAFAEEMYEEKCENTVYLQAATPSIQGQLTKTALQMMGVDILPHPKGLFASNKALEPASLSALGYGLREPISDLFSSVQSLARRLEKCQLSQSDEQFFGDCIDSIQEKEYTLLRLAYNMEMYNFIKTIKTQSLPVKEIEIHEFVYRLCKKAQRAFQNNEVPLHLEIEEGSCVATGDARLLGHVITNLFRNSLQFTQEGNEVTVRLKTTKTHILLSVIDKGLGIRADALSQVFLPYYSAYPHLDTPERPGLGLGLPLVRSAVQAMGGTVTLESEFTKGCSVHLSLPKSTAQNIALDSEPYDVEELLSDSQSPVYIQMCGYTPLPIL